MIGKRIDGDAIFGVTLIALAVCLVGTLAYGWISNIILLAHASSFTVMAMLRFAGVFVTPLGAVLGFVS